LQESLQISSEFSQNSSVMNKMLLQSKSGTLQTTVELLTTKDFFIEAKYSLQ
jgi:hypothetical protein